MVDHVLHAALAGGQELGDGAEVLLGDVDRDPLDRLVALAVDLLGHDLGLADGELEALTAHRLDEHRELQFATGLDLPGVGTLGRVDPDADVADQLGVETVLDQAGGQLLAVAPGERRGVDADRHRQRRLVDRDDGQRDRVLGVGERLADGDLGDAGDGDEIARARRSRPARG